MRFYLSLLLSFVGAAGLFAQSQGSKVKDVVTQPYAESTIRFLASNEMRGRETGSVELNIAANFIASEFQRMGLVPVPGNKSYFQQVAIDKDMAVTQASLEVAGVSIGWKTDMVVLNGNAGQWQDEAVVWSNNTKVDLKGKWVVVIFSKEESSSFSKARTASNERYNQLQSLGAAGLIEFFEALPPNATWESIAGRYEGTRMTLRSEEPVIPRIWVKAAPALRGKDKTPIKVSIQRKASQQLNTRNVVGMLEGSDPKLKNEYVMICAHYDHVGVGKPVNGDSIYNGARDNAVGTVAMMMAAKYFAVNRPKRSMLFMACTGEERGLLGSAYYTKHPLVPLNKTVFNITADGAGYNDTGRVVVLGYDRTGAAPMVDAAVKAEGLRATDNPIPQADIYGGSDNYNFAREGIPAIDFSPGFTAFDAEILKYYHQPADEADGLDYGYLMKYFRSFVETCGSVVNAAKVPYWKSGDPFEAAGDALYGKLPKKK